MQRTISAKFIAREEQSAVTANPCQLTLSFSKEIFMRGEAVTSAMLFLFHHKRFVNLGMGWCNPNLFTFLNQNICLLRPKGRDVKRGTTKKTNSVTICTKLLNFLTHFQHTKMVCNFAEYEISEISSCEGCKCMRGRSHFARD